MRCDTGYYSDSAPAVDYCRAGEKFLAPTTRTRTCDLTLTGGLLYQLSYADKFWRMNEVSNLGAGFPAATG